MTYFSDRHFWHAGYDKADSVSYEGKDKDGKPVKLTYHRSQATGVPEDIDANFLNDQYWLLLPFHVIWDTTATVHALTGPPRAQVLAVYKRLVAGEANQRGA